MEALGVNINLQPAQIADCIRDVGIGFMFAPNHHPAMKNVAPVRKELGVRTIFNILGPLTNPAGAPNILMGVFHEDLVGIQVRALQRLGAEHALVVYGRDGMDEISLGAGTLVGELKDGVVREYEVHPEDFGLRMAGTRALKVENPEESKAMLLGVLQGDQGPARDIVCLNAGAACTPPMWPAALKTACCVPSRRWTAAPRCRNCSNWLPTRANCRMSLLDAPIWNDAGTWIVLGISLLFLVVGW
jgi:anthranilate phosphoribosyltransferase